MITLNHYVRRKADVSAADFRQYWLGAHAEERLRLTSAIGARRFIVSETLHEDEVNIFMQTAYGTAADSYDFVDQLFINDLAEFKAGIANSETAAALCALHGTESDYVDHSGSDYRFTYEIPQVFTGKDCTATTETTWLKGYMVSKRLETVTAEEQRLHWIACHGAMAREYIQMLPYARYTQCHDLSSKPLEEFKAMLGSTFEDSTRITGHAEGWFDRSAIPALQTPEAGEMMKLLAEDIKLMTVAAESHAFVTKEHVFLNQPLFTPGKELPVLYSGD